MHACISRTVEEIILAFDFVYKNVKEAINIVTRTLESTKNISPKEAAIVTAFMVVLKDIDSAVSRLQLESSP